MWGCLNFYKHELIMKQITIITDTPLQLFRSDYYYQLTAAPVLKVEDYSPTIRQILVARFEKITGHASYILTRGYADSGT